MQLTLRTATRKVATTLIFLGSTTTSFHWQLTSLRNLNLQLIMFALLTLQTCNLLLNFRLLVWQTLIPENLVELILWNDLNFLKQFVTFVDVRIELPLLVVGRIRTKSSFIHAYDQSMVAEKLSEQSADPKSFVIEGWISVAVVGSLELAILQVEVLPQDLADGWKWWRFVEIWWQLSLQELLQLDDWQMVQTVRKEVVFEQG